jgi:hypothetical protein
MGIIKSLFILVIPIGGGLSYLSFWLGNKLPIACR